MKVLSIIAQCVAFLLLLGCIVVCAFALTFAHVYPNDPLWGKAVAIALGSGMLAHIIAISWAIVTKP